MEEFARQSKNNPLKLEVNDVPFAFTRSMPMVWSIAAGTSSQCSMMPRSTVPISLDMAWADASRFLASVFLPSCSGRFRPRGNDEVPIAIANQASPWPQACARVSRSSIE
jgi:hypothetical protein